MRDKVAREAIAKLQAETVPLYVFRMLEERHSKLVNLVQNILDYFGLVALEEPAKTVLKKKGSGK